MESGESEKSEEVQQKCGEMSVGVGESSNVPESQPSALDELCRKITESNDLLLARVLSGEARFDEPGAGMVLFHEVRRLRAYVEETIENARLQNSGLRAELDAAEALEDELLAERDRLREENARLKANWEHQAPRACEWDYRCRKDNPCRVHLDMLGLGINELSEMRAKLARVEALPVHDVHVLGSGLHGPAVLRSDLQAALKTVSDSGEQKL